MESSARVLRHSTHPTLIVFPLGLLSTGVIFDFIHLLGGSPTFSVIGYWMMMAGLFGGIMAAISGWADWFAVRKRTRSKTLGLVHGVVTTVVLLLYAGSLYLRYNDPAHPEIAATFFSTMGAGFGMIGGLLGGELSERLAAKSTGETSGEILHILDEPRTGRIPAIARR
jgi:uncharacterized membrane protein